MQLATLFWVFIGTAGGGSEGIYRFEFDAKTGRASDLQLAAKANEPGFLAIAPSGKFLYAVGDIKKPGEKKKGGVLAFAINRANGKLQLLNEQPCGGSGPCHIVVDKAGKTAFVANYSDGSAASFPIDSDGKLEPAASVMKHHGSSINKDRQAGPHAHSINLDPPFASVTPGDGPRHFAFHPKIPVAYVINEMGNTVTAFDYDAARGVLTKKQEVSTLPEGFKGESYTAEVVVHPSGKFLYGSNRRHDSIAVFSIASSGELTLIGIQPKGIKEPRNFAIDPTGHWLLVGNQNGHSVVFFRIKPDGNLEPTDQRIDVPTPICIRFLKK
jgi:6-phosphogluconolactonase